MVEMFIAKGLSFYLSPTYSPFKQNYWDLCETKTKYSESDSTCVTTIYSTL